jgi:hypothetical protein
MYDESGNLIIMYNMQVVIEASNAESQIIVLRDGNT